MEKLKRYIPMATFGIYFLKVIINPAASYPEALTLLILGSIAAYFEYKHQDNQIKEINARLNKMDEDVQSKLKDMEALKTGMASLKLQNGMRQVR